MLIEHLTLRIDVSSYPYKRFIGNACVKQLLT